MDVDFSEGVFVGRFLIFAWTNVELEMVDVLAFSFFGAMGAIELRNLCETVFDDSCMNDVFGSIKCGTIISTVPSFFSDELRIKFMSLMVARFSIVLKLVATELCHLKKGYRRSL